MARVGYCKHNRRIDRAFPCMECESERENAQRREKARTDEIRRIVKEELKMNEAAERQESAVSDREAFEVLPEILGLSTNSLERRVDDNYADIQTRGAWLGYQLGRASLASQDSELREAAKSLVTESKRYHCATTLGTTPEDLAACETRLEQAIATIDAILALEAKEIPK